jgi:hypothetical protein
MLAKNNEDVIKLNDMAHAELLKRGLVGPDEVEIEIINRSQSKETKKFSVGDLISFGEKSEDIAKLVGDESEIGAVYNRTKGTILKIEGAGDDASVTVQLWEGDNPINQTVTVSSKDFRTGAIPMTHSWANSCHSGQGATFSRVYVLPCGLDRAQGYVAFSRHRENLWIFGDKDSLHAHAAKHYEATRFVTRNKFTSQMSIEMLAAMVAKESIKVTTLDYSDDQLRKEMMSFRKNPMNEAAQLKRRMDQLAEKSLELLVQREELQRDMPQIKAGFQKAVAARQHEARHPTIQFGDIKVPVPKKASALEIQQILLDAIKAGHRDIQLSGNNRFRSAIFDIRAVSGIDIRFVDSRSQTLIKEMKHAARNQPQSGSGRLRTSGARHRTAPRAPALHAANISSLASHGKNSLDTQARRNRMLDLSNVQVEQGQSHKSTGSKRRI